MKIEKITKLPGDIDDLVRVGEIEGFDFVGRLKIEWEEAINRFDAPGEFLLSASSDDHTMGVCGINKDPYAADPTVARLRHLYVLPACRSRSVGSLLVKACLENLNDTIRIVRLRVPQKSTGVFYEKLGFTPVSDPTATHIFSCDS